MHTERVMNMDVLICDDNANVREILKELLIQYQFLKGLDFHIKEYSSGEELLQSNYTGEEILFLDIEMNGMNGIETAREIRKKHKNMDIVFLTSYKEYVFEGYKVNAFRYLLKPIEMDDLIETLDSIRKKMNDGENKLSFSFGNEDYCINCNEILFIEVMGRKITIHSENGVYRSVGSLKELQSKIESSNFFKTHQSFLVNMDKIKKIDNQNVYMTNDAAIPISRLRLQEFKKAYLEYWKDKL